MMNYLKLLAAKHPRCVEMKVIGSSVEGRPLYVVTVNDQHRGRPAILLEAGAHPREWIAPATLLKNTEDIVNSVCSSE